AAHQAILEKLAALPGVSAVSASSGLPLQGGCFGNTVLVEGRTIPEASIPPAARLCAVAGGYVEAMGMRLIRGHGIESGDVERRETNVIVNQAFANTFFPGADPLGHRVRSNAPPSADGDTPWLTIVGVVSNTPDAVLGEARPTSLLFMPMSIAGG